MGLRSAPFGLRRHVGDLMAFNRKSELFLPDIHAVLDQCDCFLADNAQNYLIAQELGLMPEKLSPTGPVPGTGGIDRGCSAECRYHQKRSG